MVRIELELPEDERERFARQAAREGKTLDAWLISVARQHSPLPKPPDPERFKSVEELRAFLEECSQRSGLERELDREDRLRSLEELWRLCDAQNDLEREPDWEEHLRNMDESIREGLPEV